MNNYSGSEWTFDKVAGEAPGRSKSINVYHADETHT